jgi:hypothetical protein
VMVWEWPYELVSRLGLLLCMRETLYSSQVVLLSAVKRRVLTLVLADNSADQVSLYS